MHKGYVSYLVVVRCLVMPHIWHVYVLLPLVRPHVKHAHLGLHIAVSSKDRTTCIWSSGLSFACATAMGCTGFRLSFGIMIVVELLTLIK